MNSRHRKTLMKVFTDPVSGTIARDAVEALLVAAGCLVIEGTGSRVRFAFGPEGEHVETFHRPDPATARIPKRKPNATRSRRRGRS